MNIQCQAQQQNRKYFDMFALGAMLFLLMTMNTTQNYENGGNDREDYSPENSSKNLLDLLQSILEM